jgi:hypothetical protein
LCSVLYPLIIYAVLFTRHPLCSVLHLVFVGQCSSPSYCIFPFRPYIALSTSCLLRTVHVRCSVIHVYDCLIPFYPECYTYALPPATGRTFNCEWFIYRSNN